MNERWLRPDAPITPPQPAFLLTPRSAMVFPLVVLAAVLPGLYGLKTWDLTPPGPWWGVRGLMVTEGAYWDQASVPDEEPAWPPSERTAFRSVAMQPPLYAWLEAGALALSPSRPPVATVLPSYLAGAALIVLVYLHGRLWAGRGVGLLAAVFLAFNPRLIEAMQRATPATLAGACSLLILLAHAQRLDEPPGRRGRWLALGGIALGAGLLASGGVILGAPLIILLHYAYLRAEATPDERPSGRWRWFRLAPGLSTVGTMLLIALALAGWWFALMGARHGWSFLNALGSPPDVERTRGLSLLSRLLMLAPATLPLAIYGAGRAVLRALQSEDDDRDANGGALWVIALGVSTLAYATWPTGPAATFDLGLLVPITLLASRALFDLLSRAASIRRLAILVPATIFALAWGSSDALRNAAMDLWSGTYDAATALGLHLALDLLILLYFATRIADRWAWRRDDRQRRLLRTFLGVILMAQVGLGVRELRFRHHETRGLLDLRDVIARRHHQKHFDSVAVIGGNDHVSRLAWIHAGAALPPVSSGPHPLLPARNDDPGDDTPAGGRLRFLLRAALPRVPVRTFPDVEDFRDQAGDPAQTWLIVVIGEQSDLPMPLRAELNLEPVHPGQAQVMQAYATRIGL